MTRRVHSSRRATATEQPKCMRIGYACDKKTLEDGLSALAAFAQKLSWIS